MGEALITRKGGNEFLRFENQAEIYATEDIPANNFVESIKDSERYLKPAHLITKNEIISKYYKGDHTKFIHYKDNYYIYLADSGTSAGYMSVQLITVDPGENFTYARTTLLSTTIVAERYSFKKCAEKIADDLIICYYQGDYSYTDTYPYGLFCVVKINETNGVPTSATLIKHEQLYNILTKTSVSYGFNYFKFFKIDDNKVGFIGYDNDDYMVRVLYFTFDSSGALIFQGSASFKESYGSNYVGALYNKDTDHLMIMTSHYVHEVALSDINGGVDPTTEKYIPTYINSIDLITSQYNFINDNCYYGLTNSDTNTIEFQVLNNNLQNIKKSFDREDHIIFGNGAVALFDKENNKIIISNRNSASSEFQWFVVSISDLINESRIKFKTFNSGLESAIYNDRSTVCHCHDNKYYYYFTFRINGGDTEDYFYITQYTTIPECRLAINGSTSIVGISKKDTMANNFGEIYTK